MSREKSSNKLLNYEEVFMKNLLTDSQNCIIIEEKVSFTNLIKNIKEKETKLCMDYMHLLRSV